MGSCVTSTTPLESSWFPSKMWRRWTTTETLTPSLTTRPSETIPTCMFSSKRCLTLHSSLFGASCFQTTWSPLLGSFFVIPQPLPSPWTIGLPWVVWWERNPCPKIQMKGEANNPQGPLVPPLGEHAPIGRCPTWVVAKHPLCRQQPHHERP